MCLTVSYSIGCSIQVISLYTYCLNYFAYRHDCMNIVWLATVSDLRVFHHHPCIVFEGMLGTILLPESETTD